MKDIIFYKTSSGNSPIEDFLDSLSSKEVQKVVWVLQLIEESNIVSTKVPKKEIDLVVRRKKEYLDNE